MNQIKEGDKMKDFKNGFIYFLLIIIFLLVAILLYPSEKIIENKIGPDIIKDKISQISELTTIKYSYKNVVAFEDIKQLNGFNLPFTKKTFLIVYTGYIKAGIDLKNIEIKLNEDNSIEVVLPYAKIMENVINDDDVKVFDESSNILNKLKFDDILKTLTKEKKNTEKEFIEKGLLEEANKNTKILIDNMLRTMGFDKVIVNIASK